MSGLRNLYIGILSVMIVISGCLGTVPDASGGKNSTTIEPNSVPVVDSWIIDGSSEEYLTNAGYGWNVTFYHAMVDWDGNITSAGYDTNLDGIIDFPVTIASGFPTLFIPNSSLLISPYYDGIISVVFGAMDDDGDWGSSEIISVILPPVPSSDYSTLNTYTAEDAADDASPAVDGADTLIRMQMTGKDDLAWSFVKITLSVGDNVYTCSVAAGDDCAISQQAGDNDNAWEPGEYIFLSEGTEEICSAQGCAVDISVTYSGYTVAGDSAAVVN